MENYEENYDTEKIEMYQKKVRLKELKIFYSLIINLLAYLFF